MRPFHSFFVLFVVFLGSSKNRGAESKAFFGCDVDIDCPDSNFVCKNTKCECVEGYYAVNERCKRNKVGLGEKCKVTLDCAWTVSNHTTQCLHGVCVCDYGFRSTPDKKDCVRMVRLGETCNATQDCTRTRGNKTTECWRGICSCEKGYRDTGNRDCVRVVIGEKCRDNRECHFDASSTHCAHNVCQCNNFFVASKLNNNTCLPVADYNEYCEEQHQCAKTNNACETRRCVCKKGYVWDETNCVNSQGRDATYSFCLAAGLFVVVRIM